MAAAVVILAHFRRLWITAKICDEERSRIIDLPGKQQCSKYRPVIRLTAFGGGRARSPVLCGKTAHRNGALFLPELSRPELAAGTWLGGWFTGTHIDRDGRFGWCLFTTSRRGVGDFASRLR